MFEVNLVPDVKAEMVKAQRVRNIIALFAGFILVVLGVGLLVLGGIKAGQDIAISSKEEQVSLSSKVLGDFDSLDGLLTVQKQLETLNTISENRKLLSRVFNVIWAFTLGGEDEIIYNSVDVDFNSSTISFTAQAKANSVKTGHDNWYTMEEYELTVPDFKFDYGEYVDENNETIPAICISETDENGDFMYRDGKMIARWAKNVSGCDPSNNVDENGDVKTDVSLIDEDVVNSTISAGYYEVIYRDPLFSEWYSEDGDSYMSEDGAISGVAHFASECIEYSLTSKGWSTTNTCDLAPDGVTVDSKADSMDSNTGESVLKFSASISLDSRVFMAKNHHVLAISPSGVSIRTDDYEFVGNLFTQEAVECNGVNCEVKLNEE